MTWTYIEPTKTTAARLETTTPDGCLLRIAAVTRIGGNGRAWYHGFVFPPRDTPPITIGLGPIVGADEGRDLADLEARLMNVYQHAMGRSL